MSFVGRNRRDPAPGDLVEAQVHMRAWEDVNTRGTRGISIAPGQQLLVIATWYVGNQTRILVLDNDRIHMFSCARHVVRLNWHIAGAVSVEA